MIALWLALLAGAHDLRPGAIALSEVEPGVWDLRLTPPQDGSGLPVRLDPIWPEACVRSGVRLTCNGPLEGEVVVPSLTGRRVKVVLHARHADGQVEQAVLSEGQDRLPLGTGHHSVAGYLAIGVEHVLLGIDHVLFVCGLALLARKWRPLVAAITGFTVSHSLTLALSVFGIVAAPSAATELVIALSILLVAREALSKTETWTRRWPWVVAFLFGLVHGFGFAGVLAEIGLPEGARATALLLFNVGVELGQLLIVGAAVLAWQIGRWLRLPAPEHLAAYAIGIPAAMWTLERTVVWAEALGLGRWMTG